MGDPAVTGDIVEGFRNLHRILAVKLLSWAHITWTCCSLADSGMKSIIQGFRVFGRDMFRFYSLKCRAVLSCIDMPPVLQFLSRAHEVQFNIYVA